MIAEPHFDADGNFIHRCCKCGEEASFGYGVSLRRGRLGTWYCAKHQPQQQTTPTTNGANSTLCPPPEYDTERQHEPSTGGCPHVHVNDGGQAIIVRAAGSGAAGSREHSASAPADQDR
jgi:hypothetical protein